MNLRQKAKNYKRLYEQMKSRPVNVIHGGEKHYRVIRRANRYEDAYGMARRGMIADLEEVLERNIEYKEEEGIYELNVWLKR